MSAASPVFQGNSSPLKGLREVFINQLLSETPEMSKKYARAIILWAHTDTMFGTCVITRAAIRDIDCFYPGVFISALRL